MAKVIMVQGTTSNAGKSFLAAALCRIFKQDGYSVAPFKSQNMALNSFITDEGLEMGRAQVMQAEAAGIKPSVRMNPILLKPTGDTGSQVIVNGKVRGDMTARAYFAMKRTLIPDIMEAYNSLAAEHDIIVIEGAGSPAEINLRKDDIVNMGMAELVDAPVLLCGDIDRGGVFASLYGTVALLQPEERARIQGLVINKFRGDVEILRPGLDMLEDLTHIKVAGVIPYLRLDLDDEDSLTERFTRKNGPSLIDIAVIRLPRISNFTDFNPGADPAGLPAVREHRGGAGGPGRDPSAGYEKHHGRPEMAADLRPGGGHSEARLRRETRGGHLRRLSDDGQPPVRPGRGGGRRRDPGHGPSALGDGVYGRQDPHPCHR